jgi:hypothetical protein
MVANVVNQQESWLDVALVGLAVDGDFDTHPSILQLRAGDSSRIAGGGSSAGGMALQREPA